MAREPAVAGMFYEKDKEKLRKNLGQYFSAAKKSSGKEVIGVIAPHAGYFFSGKAAAQSISAIKEKPEIFVIIGICHQGCYGTATSLQDWKTPLGIAKVDKDFAKMLAAEGIVSVDEAAHAAEHSIEVQLLFLQYKFGDIVFCPVAMGYEADYKEVAGQITTLLKSRKKAVIIASSDFTHYGPNYNYLPFRKNIKENMYKLDKGAIDFILKLDAGGFLAYCEKTGATICGKDAIAVLLELMKKMDAKAELLDYYTSGDVIDDYANAVAYASIIFCRQKKQ